MSTIEIEHPHRLGRQGCIAAADAVAGELARRYGLDAMEWSGDTLHFAGRGVEGTLVAGADAARVEVHLGGLASLLRPAIEAEIRRQLQQHLG